MDAGWRLPSPVGLLCEATPKLLAAPTHRRTIAVRRLSQLPAPPWLPHLEALHAQDNDIAALGPLHGLPSLRTLNLSFNRCVHRKHVPCGNARAHYWSHVQCRE